MDILNEYSLKTTDLQGIEIFGEVKSEISDKENLKILSQDNLFLIIQEYGNLMKNVTLNKPDLSLCPKFHTLCAPVRFGYPKFTSEFIVYFESKKAMHKVFKKIILQCNNITNLTVDDNLNINLQDLVKSNRKLKSYFSCTPISDFNRSEMINLPESLEELIITTYFLKRDQFNSFMENHTALKTLILHNSLPKLKLQKNTMEEICTINDTIQILSRYAINLESLYLVDLNSSFLSNASIESLSNFSNLETLHIHGDFKVTEEMVRKLRKCTSLEDISFRVKEVSTEVLNELLEFPKIESISIDIYSDFESTDIRQCIEKFSNVINLTTSGYEVLFIDSTGLQIEFFNSDSSTVNETVGKVNPIKLTLEFSITGDIESVLQDMQKEHWPGIEYTFDKNLDDSLNGQQFLNTTRITMMARMRRIVVNLFTGSKYIKYRKTV